MRIAQGTKKSAARVAILLSFLALTHSSVYAQAAAGATSINGTGFRCATTKGTLAIDDGRQKDWFGRFNKATQITSLEPLIRAFVQRSNCFVIVAGGSQASNAKLGALGKMQGTSAYRPGSEMGPNQRVAADYFMEPSIVFKEPPPKAKSGIGSVLGGILNRAGIPAASDMLSVEQMEATVTLSLWDVRSGALISSSQGKKKLTNYGGAVGELKGLFGGSSEESESLEDYSNTPAGKATAAAFQQSFDSLAIAVENYRPQQVEGGLGTGGNLKVQGQ